MEWSRQFLYTDIPSLLRVDTFPLYSSIIIHSTSLIKMTSYSDISWKQEYLFIKLEKVGFTHKKFFFAHLQANCTQLPCELLSFLPSSTEYCSSISILLLISLQIVKFVLISIMLQRLLIHRNSI